MNGRQFTFGASGNPLVQILSLVVFALVVVGAVIMGTFVLLTFLGLATIGFVVFTIRVWWLRRKLKGSGRLHDGPPGPASAGGWPNGGAQQPGPGHTARLIEGEYEVVDTDADADRRDGER